MLKESLKLFAKKANPFMKFLIRFTKKTFVMKYMECLYL